MITGYPRFVQSTSVSTTRPTIIVTTPDSAAVLAPVPITPSTANRVLPPPPVMSDEDEEQYAVIKEEDLEVTSRVRIRPPFTDPAVMGSMTSYIPVSDDSLPNSSIIPVEMSGLNEPYEDVSPFVGQQTIRSYERLANASQRQRTQQPSEPIQVREHSSDEVDTVDYVSTNVYITSDEVDTVDYVSTNVYITSGDQTSSSKTKVYQSLVIRS